MKKNYSIILFSLLIWMPLLSISQISESKILEVGDKLPASIIERIEKVAEGPAKYKSFTGKHIIFHFWNTSCATSRESLPVMETLQEQFAKDLIIILINNSDNEEKVNAYFEQKNVQKPRLLMVFDIPLLERHFPHNGVPFDAWVNEGGEVMARTTWDYVTSRTIKRVIVEGEQVGMYEVHYEHIPEKEPLLQANKGQLGSQPLYYHAITGRKNGGGSGKGNFRGSHLHYNQSVASLYASAFEIPILQKRTRVVYEVSDSIKTIMLGPEKGTSIESLNRFYQWSEDYLFCYNAFINEHGLLRDYKQQREINEIMQRDLNNYFGLFMGIEGQKMLREVQCFMLEKLADRTVDDKSGMSLKSIASILESQLYRYGKPVVLSEGLSGTIQSDFLQGDLSFSEISGKLNEAGYELVDGSCELEVLVISKRK